MRRPRRRRTGGRLRMRRGGRPARPRADAARSSTRRAPKRLTGFSLGAGDLYCQQLGRRASQLVHGAGREAIATDELDVRRQHIHGELATDAQRVAVVVTVHFVVPLVVEVAHPLVLGVDRLDGDRALLVLLSIAAPGRVGQVVGVCLDDHRPAEIELLDDVLGERAVDHELLHLEPVQPGEVFGRRLEERPLVAFEVDRDAEREHRQRLESLGVQQLDPEIRVAVGLGELPVGRVQLVRAVGRGVEAEQRRHVRRLRPDGGVRAPRPASCAGRAHACGRARA